MILLLSHFGRPKGPDSKNSLKQVVPAVAAALGRPVGFVSSDCIGEQARVAVNRMRRGDVLCLENTRFPKGRGALHFRATEGHVQIHFRRHPL